MNSFDPKLSTKICSDHALKRRCILVLGMHRSGTSALTRVLNFAGAQLPLDLMGANFGNELGHWESNRLVELHERFLLDVGSSWQDWRSLDLSALSKEHRARIKGEMSDVLAQEYGRSSLFIVKDPRICRFAPLFLEVLDEAGIDVAVVIPFRNPLEICDSLYKRDGLLSAETALLWLRHVLDAEQASRDRKRVIVSFDRLLSDWRGLLEAISSELALEWPTNLDEIAPELDSFLSPDHRHQMHDESVLDSNVALRGWVADAFRSLKELSERPDSRTATQMLDALNSELRRAEPLTWEYFQSLQNRISMLKSTNRDLEAQAQTYRRQYEEEKYKLLPPIYRNCWRILRSLLPANAADRIRRWVVSPREPLTQNRAPSGKYGISRTPGSV
jgi:hypothetical protein